MWSSKKEVYLGTMIKLSKDLVRGSKEKYWARNNIKQRGVIHIIEVPASKIMLFDIWKELFVLLTLLFPSLSLCNQMAHPEK